MTQLRLRQVEKVDLGPLLYPYQKTGAAFLRDRRAALLCDQMGLGKAQPNSEPVLRPDGQWTPIGTLRPGDYVMGSNGRPTRVIGVYPQGKQKIYELTFDDGAKTRSTGDHLWSVRTAYEKWYGKDFKARTLHEIMAKGLTKVRAGGRVNKTWFIPVALPFEFPEQRFELAPYLLGALLANADFTRKGTISHSGWAEQREFMRGYLPADYEYSQIGNDEWDYRIVKKDRSTSPNWVAQQVFQLGLHSNESHERFIPDLYMVGSVRQRKDLLEGLFDNDGCISADGLVIEYNTTSPRLATQVTDLVRSLGGVAWVSKRRSSYEYKGEKKLGRVDHRIRVALDFCPFRVSWKRERFRPRSKYQPTRAILDVAEVGREEAVCIAVDASDSLYVTRDYVLTHNTVQVIAAVRDDEGALVVCPASLIGNWLRELQRFRPDLLAREQASPYDLPRPGEILVTAYSRLPRTSVDGGTLGAGLRKDLFVLSTKDDGPAARAGIVPGDLVYAVAGVPVGTLQDLSRILADCGTTEPTPVEVRRAGKLLVFRPTLAPRDPKATLARWLGEKPSRPFTLVADEAHYLKNWQSARARRFSALMAVSSRVWLLTGTPLMNRPPELWALLQSCRWSGRRVYGSWNDFVRVFSGKKLYWGGYEWGTPSAAAGERLRDFMLRRTRDDVLPDLPQKTAREVPVAVSRKGILGQDFRFIDSWTDARVEAESQEGGALSQVRAELAEAKYEALSEMLADFQASEEPVVVFSAHRRVPEALSRRAGWAAVLGDTTLPDRDRAVRAFQDGLLEGIAGTILAMGTGFTLTRSAHVVFVDRSFVPAENLQAEDRLVRIGQTRGVVVTVLVADHPVDRRVAEILRKKTLLLEQTGLL